MTLPWYLWIAFVACSLFLLLDCGVFYRNAKRAEFGWINLLGMTIELFAAVYLIVHGTGVAQ